MTNKKMMDNRNRPAMPIGEQIDGYHLNPVCNGLTKLEDLAMRLYVEASVSEHKEIDDPEYLTGNARKSMLAANIFFDELEKGNE